MRNIRVAATQFQHLPGDIPGNLAIVERMVAEAADKGVEIMAFPECCLSGYWHLRHLEKDQLTELAQPLPDGRAAQQLLAWSKQYQMTIGAGLIEIDGGMRMYNS